MRRLTMYVHAVERDDNGTTLQSQSFGPGDEVPAWARKAISNPDVWEGEDDAPAESDSAQVKRPNKAGAGSSVEAWRTYAEQAGVQVEDGASRDEIIAAVEAAEK